MKKNKTTDLIYNSDRFYHEMTQAAFRGCFNNVISGVYRK